MAIVDLDRQQSFALLAEMNSARNLLAYGVRVVRTAAFIDTTRDPILTMLSIGVEKLYKLTLGLVNLADEQRWPTKAVMKRHGHGLESMHEAVMREIRARVAGKSEYVRGLVAEVDDAAWHTVLWVSQWPQTATYPGFLAPLLLTSGVQRTLTIRYEPIPAGVAARDLRRKRTGHLSEAAQRAKVGQVTDAAEAAEYDDIQAQEAELAAGHGVLRATGLITVSATDAEALEHDVAAVEQTAL